MKDDERFTPAADLPQGLLGAALALAATMRDVEGHTVPWTAGRSRDGTEFYPDHDLPMAVANVKTRDSVKVHEAAELIWMNTGDGYDRFSDPPGVAHYHANGCEKIVVEQQGGEWTAYYLALRPIMKEIDAEVLANMPPLAKWDTRPYADDDRKLLDQIDAAEKAVIVLNSGGAALSKGDSTVDNLQLFVPITKIDVAKCLVYGTLAEEIVDKSKEIFDYASSKPFFKKWSDEFAKVTDGKSVGNLRAMHQPIAAGKLTDIVFNDPDKKINICAHVVDAGEWEKVDKGVYTGFSMGGRYVKRWDDPVNGGVMRYTGAPAEVSLVDNPCIPTATFSAIKADGSTEMRKFTSVIPVAAPTPVVEPHARDVAERAMKLATDAKSAQWVDFVADAHAELVKEAAAPKPKLDSQPQPLPALSASEDGNWSQVWASPDLLGQTFATKAELRSALTKKAADAAAGKTAAPVVDALKSLTTALDKHGPKPADPPKPEPVEIKIVGDTAALAGDIAEVAKVIGAVKTVTDLRVALMPLPAAIIQKLALLAPLNKREFSEDERKKAAASGAALKDGSFPIENKDDLENAIKAYGRAKNKAAAKRHIIKRAKALGATDMLPEDWRGSTKGEVADSKKIATLPAAEVVTKNLYFAQGLVGLLAQLEGWEEDFEHITRWGAADPERAELCNQFGAVLVEFADLVAAIVDRAVNAITAEEEAEATGAVVRALNIVGLLKVAGERALMKAGARHSAKDMELLNKAHDTLVDLGADCKGNSEKSEPAGELGKVTTALQAITAERDALTKQFDGLVPLLKDISERVQRIEAQPVVIPPRSLLALGKDGTVTALNGGKEPAGDPLASLNIDEFVKTLDEDKVKNLARALIKRSHENPLMAYGPGR